MDLLVCCMFVIEHLSGLNLLSIIPVRRKQNHTGDDRQPPESWYLSGVGENMEWDAYALKPGYDIRNAVDEPKGDFVVAYTSRYYFAVHCVLLTLKSLHPSYVKSTY